ncbi:hypothetical protein JDV02_006295 [Purpureocillium takamizusanense]|uniref:Uncharacterized protein n=1 Tax=Purpureocillium takamizusanense TaxID=2060973 RepID=A0A9Q8VCS4_9HYPO|nr:uncharacterized protein JDV02_006295 [Purpureocillium takamizusanense]UNI20179.1 hypothetical protein JDV02_006295 [Purpureocillium takamizusanense]
MLHEVPALHVFLPAWANPLVAPVRQSFSRTPPAVSGPASSLPAALADGPGPAEDPTPGLDLPSRVLLFRPHSSVFPLFLLALFQASCHHLDSSDSGLAFRLGRRRDLTHPSL